MDAITALRETLDLLEQIEVNYLLIAYEGYPPPKEKGQMTGASRMPPKGTFAESQLTIKDKLAHAELQELRTTMNHYAGQLHSVATRYAKRLEQIAPGEPHNCPACKLTIYGGRKGRCCREDENKECYNTRQAERVRKCRGGKEE